MAGELWRSQFQVGKETTPGTPVAATRKLYFDLAGKLDRMRTARPHKFATGSRDNVRAFTLGPQSIAGAVSQPLSASEIIELLLMGIGSGITPTQPDAGGNPTVYLWTFTPGTALQAATLEWDDGGRPWQATGMYANKLKIAGSVRDQNTVSADLLGLKMVQNALTGALGARVPDFIEGWETKLYIDSYGGTAGSTNVAGTLINWDIQIDNLLTPKQHADNVNAADGLIPGEIGITAKLLFEASKAVSLTEFNNWDAATSRLVRVEFGQNSVISTTYKKFVTVDLPGAWDKFDLGQSDEGTRAYELSLQYVYDVTNTFGLQIRAQNTRSAAW